MIEVDTLTKNYGSVSVLRDVSFRAFPGQITILTGDNGAGKSTLLRILAGLSRATSGTAKLAGRDIAADRLAAQANLSFLPQGLMFHPAATPRQLMRFYASLRGRAKTREQGEALLNRFDLSSESQKQIRHLSGGMVQRLGLALLLLPEAPILLLDEPSISLDPTWRARLAVILGEEAAGGKTVLLTTHLPGEWEGGSHQRLCCRDTKIIPVDTIDIKADPKPIHEA